MPHRTTIVGNRPVFSETTVLEAVGDELLAIKQSDGLSWNDMAAVLGVSDVQAAKYVDGSAKMSIVTYARAKREWNGRFTGALDRLCAESRPASHNHRECESKVLQAALALSVALADGELTQAEIRQNRSTIEAAKDALEGLLSQLAPRNVA